jgi:hypothetical protein
MKIDINSNEYVIHYQLLSNKHNNIGVSFGMTCCCIKVGKRSPDFQIVTDFLHPPAEVENMTNKCASAPIVEASAYDTEKN